MTNPNGAGYRPEVEDVWPLANTQKIKGICEHCGHAHTGYVEMENNSFPTILCPNCGKATDNFDDVTSVDYLNKAEEKVIEYIPTNTYLYA